MTRKLRLLFVVAALGYAIGMLPATTVKTVNIDEMVTYADRVFYGRCLDVADAQSQAGFAVSEYTFEVLEGIKGVASGERVTFRQVQPGKAGQMMGIPGMPSYRPGQKLVLFLHGNSQLGLTSPVGFSQGVFQLRHDGEALTAVNGLGNSNLASSLSEVQGRDMGLTTSQYEELKRGGAIRFETLASAVRQIERTHQEKGKSIQ